MQVCQQGGIQVGRQRDPPQGHTRQPRHRPVVLLAAVHLRGLASSIEICCIEQVDGGTTCQKS